MFDLSEAKSYRVQFDGGIPGVTLAGIVDRPRDWKPTIDNEVQPVVVYSHCFTCSKDLKATVRISRALARAGIAVLRFDMMGLGGSNGEFADSNFTTNLADLSSAIRFAKSELGPVTGLVGHSFGGIASLVTASNAFDCSGQGEKKCQIEPDLSQLGFVATLAAPSDTLHLATLLSRKNPRIESEGSGDVSVGAFRWMIRKQMLDDFRRHDVTDKLAQLSCPVLLLHSPIDEVVGMDHAIRLMTLIQANRSNDRSMLNPVSLVSLPGADHLLANEKSDLTFVARLLAAWCHRYRPTTVL